MILLTVGTLFPFDRLVRAVDELAGSGVIDEPVFAQIGKDAYQPRHLEHAESLSRDEFEKKFSEVRAIISHAGMGTISTAVDQGKPLLVMPREKRYGEHVNDHQVATARRFESLGCLLAAYDADQLAEKLPMLDAFVPAKRDTNVQAVAERISDFLSQLKQKKKL